MKGGEKHDFEVDSVRPNVAETPWWMRKVFGHVAEELRVPLGLLVLLAVIGFVLSCIHAPSATLVWDLVKAMVGGGIGGGAVAWSVRRR